MSIYEPEKNEYVSREINNEQIRPMNKTLRKALDMP